MAATRATDSISFLVAAYRMAPYITGMLDSIRSAMQPGDELIIVDDGSPDDTLARCQDWRERYLPAARLIAQTNQGVCASRNNAFGLASCNYVLFLDGDDEVITPTIQNVRKVLAQLQPDIVEFDFDYWHPNSSTPLTRSKSKSHRPQELLSDKETLLCATLEDRAWALWSRLIRRSVLTESKAPLFDQALVIDDVPTTPYIVSCANNLYYLPEPIIKYRSTPDSLSKQRSAKLCLDIAASPAEALRRMSPTQFSPRLQSTVHLWIARMFYEGVRLALYSPECKAALFKTMYRRSIEELFPEPSELIRSLQATGIQLDRKIAREIQRFAQFPRMQSQLRALSARVKRAR